MAAPQPPSEPPKPCHTIILDSSPLLLNTPGISTLRAHSNELITTPTVIAEIKHEEAKNRIQTLYMPFLAIRTPKPESLRFVKEFARKTGDAAVLSQTDLEILALAYELECERNGGDWRLRNTPGQKRVNGSPPEKKVEEQDGGAVQTTAESQEQPLDPSQVPRENEPIESTQEPSSTTEDAPVETNLESLQISQPTEATDPTVAEPSNNPAEPESQEDPTTDSPSSASDNEGWITPSNIKKRQLKDESSTSTTPNQRTLQVATITGDFAMQNVLLQINLNLLSPKTCARITTIKRFILRCHACFATTKILDRQFCDRCGKPTLTRVSATTNANGEVKLHLKKNMQWNNRGNVFSIPKPTAGTSNQKWQKGSGGGKGGWGNGLVLAEDQKEYVRAMGGERRRKERDLMDEDTLPGILTGERKGGGGGAGVRVGAGRGVNSRKR